MLAYSKLNIGGVGLPTFFVLQGVGKKKLTFKKRCSDFVFEAKVSSGTEVCQSQLRLFYRILSTPPGSFCIFWPTFARNYFEHKK